MNNSELLDRSSYTTFYPVTTSWSDNDIYAHINNVVYYAYFDSVTYPLAVFKIADAKASAFGSFVHVFVDRNVNTSTSIPSQYRFAFESILVADSN